MLDNFEPEVQPSLRLDSFHLADLKFHIDQKFWQTHELTDTSFKVNFTHIVKDDDKNYFGILFKVFLQNEDKSIELNFEFIGHFEAKGIQIKEDSIETNQFFRFSAPAIVFPYIRTFVSNFILTAGFKPIILPTLNFTNSKPINKASN